MDVLLEQERLVLSDEALNHDVLELLPLVHASCDDFPNLLAYLCFVRHDRRHLRVWARGVFRGTKKPVGVGEAVHRLFEGTRREFEVTLVADLLSPLQLCRLVGRQAGSLGSRDLRFLLGHWHAGVRLVAAEQPGLRGGVVDAALLERLVDVSETPLVLTLLRHPNASVGVVREFVGHSVREVRAAAVARLGAGLET